MTFENERVFMEKLANVFLKSRAIEVKEGGMNIAYCNVKTKKIFFNFAEIFKDKDNIFKEIMVYKGLGFHEIMHLKFTTRHRLSVYQDHKFVELLQQLEDGRIETLGVIAHEKLADYFIYAVNEVLLKEKSAMLRNVNNSLISGYILCYGRSIYFQDLKLLALIRELLIKTYGKDLVDKVENSIDSYLTATKSEDRLKIAQDLYDYLNKSGINELPPEMSVGKNDSISIECVIDNRKDDNTQVSKEMKEILDQMPKVEKVKKEIKKELENATKDVKDGSNERGKFKKEQEKKVSEIKKEIDEKRKEIKQKENEFDKTTDKQKQDEIAKDLNKLDAELDKKEQELSDNDGVQFKPNIDKQTQKEIDKIVDAIVEVLEKVAKDQDEMVDKHHSDIADDLKSIGHEIEEVYADNSFQATDEMHSKARELTSGLQKLNNELSKGYVSQMRTGRINVRTILSKQGRYGYLPDTKVFNKWTPDRIKETKMLVNIFFDGSGSMKGDKFDKTLKSCWIINEALNRDENKVMVYEFSTNFLIAKEYDKPLTVPTFLNQYTYPSYAILNAIPKIEAYKKAKGFNFVVDIIITDGCFDDKVKTDKLISQLNSYNHETIFIGVGYGLGNRDSHNAKHVMGLNNFDELVGGLIRAFTQIKKGLIARVKVN